MGDDFDHPEATGRIVGGMLGLGIINELDKINAEKERQRSLPDCPHSATKYHRLE